MNQQMPAGNTKERLSREFDAVVAETEHLLKAAAGAGAEKAGELQVGIERQYSAAAERLARVRDEAIVKCGAVAKSTDAYVQGNPWRSVGIVATFALAAGLVAGLLISRR